MTDFQKAIYKSFYILDFNSRLEILCKSILDQEAIAEKDSKIKSSYYDYLTLCLKDDLPDMLLEKSVNAYIEVLKDFIQNANIERIEDSKYFHEFIEIRNKIIKELNENKAKYDPSGGNGDYIGY